MRREHDDVQKPVAGPMEEAAEVPGAALPDALTSFIGYLLRRVYAQFSATAGGGEADLRDFVVLDALAARDWLSQVELAERLGINRTVMVAVIDRLEQSGHVVRTRNPDNRRSYVLSLTDEGRTALAAARRAVAERDRQLTEALTDTERARLDELLGRLLPAHEQQPAVPSTEYLVTQAHYRLRKVGDDKLTGTGLRVRHFGPLAVLDGSGPLAQQQLAEHLAITEPAASPLVEELVKAGLVGRGRDPHDRRRYALEITDAGRQQLLMLHKAVDELQSDIAAMLGPGGDAELHALLLKVLETDPPA